MYFIKQPIIALKQPIIPSNTINSVKFSPRQNINPVLNNNKPLMMQYYSTNDTPLIDTRIRTNTSKFITTAPIEWRNSAINTNKFLTQLLKDRKRRRKQKLYQKDGFNKENRNINNIYQINL